MSNTAAQRLNEIRNKLSVEVELPNSKIKVRVRPIYADAFVDKEGIPNFLLPVVERLMKGDGVFTKTDAEAEADGSSERTREYLGLADLVFSRSIIDPPVRIGEGDADHLGTRDFPLEDRLSLFSLLYVDKIEELHSFRPRSEKDVASLQNDEGNVPAAE